MSSKKVDAEPSELIFKSDSGQQIINIKFKPDLHSQMHSVLSEVVGYHEARQLGVLIPASVLAVHRDAIVEEFTDCQLDYTKANSPYTKILKAIDDYLEEIREQLDAKLAKGLIEFNDLPFVFPVGTKVATHFQGKLLGGTIA